MCALDVRCLYVLFLHFQAYFIFVFFFYLFLSIYPFGEFWKFVVFSIIPFKKRKQNIVCVCVGFPEMSREKQPRIQPA